MTKRVHIEIVSMEFFLTGLHHLSHKEILTGNSDNE